MADDSEGPKGQLEVRFKARLPSQADTLYKWLNHPLRETDVHAFSCECSQAEGRKLVEKIRASNTGLDVQATWVGGQTL